MKNISSNITTSTKDIIIQLENIISSLEEENIVLKNKLRKINKLTSNVKIENRFKKVSAKLADHGFRSMWLKEDWQGVDFIASHINGEKTLKIILENNFSLNQNYMNQNIHICFINNNDIYLYPHDLILEQHISLNSSQDYKLLLEPYKL
ncbi:MAG: hypothetical protein HOH31_05035 [Campylobacteraceae bacterium]|jgi:hypothetical protein|nr:hypothetical protein [Campylobacteraceae bacterium]MBT6107938.1 hypothetical protein [Campylobacteraceae bacterium]